MEWRLFLLSHRYTLAPFGQWCTPCQPVIPEYVISGNNKMPFDNTLRVVFKVGGQKYSSKQEAGLSGKYQTQPILIQYGTMKRISLTLPLRWIFRKIAEIWSHHISLHHEGPEHSVILPTRCMMMCQSLKVETWTKIWMNDLNPN